MMEIFEEVENKDPMKTKQLEKGLLQLTDEGVAQLFTQFGGNKKIIGCVGELQFEVIQYRLLHEYGASVFKNHSLWARYTRWPSLSLAIFPCLNLINSSNFWLLLLVIQQAL